MAYAESQRLAADPNIVSVGVGLKLVGGKPTMVASLHYYVWEKLTGADEIRERGSEHIQNEVGGYKTDVVQMRSSRRLNCPTNKRPTGQRGEQREAPLVGGTSTSILTGLHNFAMSWGTLGGICFDAGSNASMAISNAHVWDGDIGDDVIQPFPSKRDYVGGTIEWLACGGPLSHILTWTAPSPTTAILTSAAAAAWVAAAASDAEDPTRWGQRTGPVPRPGVKTIRERIHIDAPLPRLPFAGRHWESKATWGYTRDTTAGSSSVETTEVRPNEHVLVGKRVFTHREVYSPGATVNICSQIWTPAGDKDPERFVVAHSFPIKSPERVIQRVLHPGTACADIDKRLDYNRKPLCVRGFKHQLEGVAAVNFPILAAPFILIGEDSSVLLDPGPDNPTDVTALRLPDRILAFACPPSTHIELTVFHRGSPVRARAISANGATVSEEATPSDANVVHKLRLSGPEIIRVELAPGRSKSYLAGICADKHMIDVRKWKGVSNYYGGSFRLPLREPDGKWAVVVVSQSLDNTPTNGNPITAARRLGGIMDSANVTETGECVCEVLFDATFDVETVELL